MTEISPREDYRRVLVSIGSCHCLAGCRTRPTEAKCVVCLAQEVTKKHHRDAGEDEDCPEETIRDLRQRCQGMGGTLARIRKKADLASGLRDENGQEEDDTCEGRDIAGRASGAEGAVDLLIAHHACALREATTGPESFGPHVPEELARELGRQTGVGQSDCIRALRLNDGDMRRSARYLQQQGQS